MTACPAAATAGNPDEEYVYQKGAVLAVAYGTAEDITDQVIGRV